LSSAVDLEKLPRGPLGCLGVDFTTIEVWTRRGLVTYYLLFFVGWGTHSRKRAFVPPIRSWGDEATETRSLSFKTLASRMNLDLVPLIVTDGFEFYKRVVRRIFGIACLYCQVIKTRRNDRIIKVERRTLIGDPWGFEETLQSDIFPSTMLPWLSEKVKFGQSTVLLGGR
jgi:hypothetical protein